MPEVTEEFSPQRHRGHEVMRRNVTYLSKEPTR
jgi:hypothetical protein